MSERPCPKCGKGCTACFDAGYSYVRPLESQNQALQERAEKAEALLLRLHGWDIMDVTSDGPYWQREIDQLLSPTQETDPE